MKRILLVLISVILSFSSLKAQNKFLSISDIHFDPYYDSTLFSQLVESDYTKWEKIFRSSAVKLPSRYGKDTNYPLLLSALTDMKTRIPDPDYVIITGDFMSHKFNENFFHFYNSKDENALHKFIEKTIRFITLMIVTFYPDEIIFPSLGNDDAYCGNYMVDPDGKFLSMTADAWEPLVNKNGINPSFESDFSKGGYCAMNVPGENNFKLIVLNTIYFSINYENNCGNLLADPGINELDWLHNTLLQCKMNDEKVWLYYHIPPGIDVYGTIHNVGNCENRTITAYSERYNDELIRIVKKFSGTINASFGGHFHRDDFRIIYNNFSPVNFISLNSSVSPIYDNNPSYKIYAYGKADFTLKNYDSYYLNREDEDNLEWKFLYNFNDAYKQNGINAAAYENIFRIIETDTTMRSSYIHAYTSNAASYVADMDNWYYNWCAMVHFSKTDYAACLCSQLHYR